MLGFLFTFLLLSQSTPTANAGYMELSVGFMFTKQGYNEQDYTWSRRYSASLGYYFTEISGLEFAYQNVVTRTFIEGFQDTTFNDQIYSLNWVQALLPRKSIFQPYFKIGVGQLNREATGSYFTGESPPLQTDSITGVVSLGFRLFFLQNFAWKTEGTAYLVGGSLSTWEDNFAFTTGLSWFY